MNNILDKMGAFDLVSVLLVGIMTETLSLCIFQYVYRIDISINSYINETLLFLILSYFLGMIFQECSSFIQKRIIFRNEPIWQKSFKVCNRKAKAAKGEITSSVNNMTRGSGKYLSLKEIEELSSYITRLLSEKSGHTVRNEEENTGKNHTNEGKLEKDSNQLQIEVEEISPYNYNQIYDFCRYYLMKNYDTTVLDRHQSLSAMSRSLSLYFCVVTVSLPVSAIFYHNLVSCWPFIMILSAFMAVVFYYRFYRFSLYRSTDILRLYYYNEVVGAKSGKSTIVHGDT